MATFLSPTVEYKAPTFQELYSPLAIYKEAYDKVKEKYDVEADKAALLRAMMGTDPNNEISQYMSEYNGLLNSVSKNIAENVPYSQLSKDVSKLNQMWRDKGIPAQQAINSLTKYREARSKVPGAIGRELTFNDFLADPNRSYSIIDPEKIRAAAVLSGQTFAQNNPLKIVGKGPNRQLILSSDATDEQIANDIFDENTQLGRDFALAMKQYGISDEDATEFANLWISGLVNSRKYVYQNDVVANEQAAIKRQQDMYTWQQQQQQTYNETPKPAYPGSDVYIMPGSNIRLKLENGNYRPLTREENISFSEALSKPLNEKDESDEIHKTRMNTEVGDQYYDSKNHIKTRGYSENDKKATAETWRSTDNAKVDNDAVIENGYFVKPDSYESIDIYSSERAYKIALKYCQKYDLNEDEIFMFESSRFGRNDFIIIPYWELDTSNMFNNK